MKNLKLFTRFVSMLSISGMAFVATLPKNAMAWQVHGTTRTNVTINRNINVNRNVNVYRSSYYQNSIGVGEAIAISVAGIAVGSMITAAALPPSCRTVVVNGVTYQQCGNNWYQPKYSGSQVNFIVINPPR